MANRLIPGRYGSLLGEPSVNYNTGDYRKISKLERERAEMAKNAALEGEIRRQQQWKDLAFSKRLQNLQESLFGGGGVGGGVGGSVGGSTTFGPGGGGGMPQMGGGGFGGGGPMTSVERMMGQNPELSKYLELLRSARMITGPNANPYALGYNFGTLTGRGGYFGKAAPVPDLPGDLGSLLRYGQSGTAPVGGQMPGRSPGWATYQRPELTDEQLWALSGSNNPYPRGR